jgi:hypothetical protein
MLAVKKSLHSKAGMLAGLVLAVAMTACTGPSHSASKRSTTTTTRHAVPTSVGPATTATTVFVPKYDPAKNVRRDVSPGACVDGGSKGWSFKGTVTNSAVASRGYSIAVDFITVPGDTVMATKVITVPKIAPHDTKGWSVTGAAPGQKHLTCVVRQALAT